MSLFLENYKKKFICNNLRVLWVGKFFLMCASCVNHMKQTPQAWFGYFTTHLIQYDFIASWAVWSLFVRNVNSFLTYLILYVDDIILIGNNMSYVSTLVHQLRTTFDMIDTLVLILFLDCKSIDSLMEFMLIKRSMLEIVLIVFEWWMQFLALLHVTFLLFVLPLHFVMLKMSMLIGLCLELSLPKFYMT